MASLVLLNCSVHSKPTKLCTGSGLRSQGIKRTRTHTTPCRIPANLPASPAPAAAAFLKRRPGFGRGGAPRRQLAVSVQAASKSSGGRALPTFRWRNVGIMVGQLPSDLAAGAVALLIGVPVLGPNWSWPIEAPGEVLVTAGEWAAGIIAYQAALSAVINSAAVQERYPEFVEQVQSVGITSNLMSMYAFGCDKGRVPEVALALAGTALAIGFCEELSYRGALQGGLQWALSFSPAVPGELATAVAFGTASVVFASLHSYTDTAAYNVAAGVIGAIFGVEFIVTGDLLQPILSHAMIDAYGLGVCYWRMTYQATLQEQKDVFFNNSDVAAVLREEFEGPFE